MKTDAIIENINKIGIACYGNDALKYQDCTEISIAGKKFKVLSSGVSNSLSNTPVLWLQLDVKNKEDIPMGEVKIVA